MVHRKQHSMINISHNVIESCSSPSLLKYLYILNIIWLEKPLFDYYKIVMFISLVNCLIFFSNNYILIIFIILCYFFIFLLYYFFHCISFCSSLNKSNIFYIVQQKFFNYNNKGLCLSNFKSIYFYFITPVALEK